MAKKKQHSVLGVPFKSSLKINTEALGFCKRLFEIQSLLRGASETPRSQAEEWVFSRGRCTVMHTACMDFNDEPCGIKFCVKKKLAVSQQIRHICFKYSQKWSLVGPQWRPGGSRRPSGTSEVLPFNF